MMPQPVSNLKKQENKLTRMSIFVFLVCLVLIGSALLFYAVIPHPQNSETLGKVRLNIPTYLAGKNQPTHPSIVVFPSSWNGAKYWMAYSPYPYANGEEENPCIAVSNDMLYWETPKGLVNPIATNEETACDELKDPHLVYREDLDHLEMWYLGRLDKSLGGDGTSLLLFRKISNDGVHWSEYEIMSATEYLSPSIIWDGEKYQMWSIGYELWGTEGTVVYQESTDGKNWTSPVKCSIGGNRNNDIWHGSVSFYNNAYHFVYIDQSDRQEVFYCTSTDGVSFNKAKVIVENGNYWDYLYRPAIAQTEEGLFCLYGVVNRENQWFISMSSGDAIDTLVGISGEDISNMYPLRNDVTDTHSVRYWVKQLYQMIQLYLRFELLALAFVESAALLLSKRLSKSRWFLPICVVGNFALTVVYFYARLCPGNGLTAFAAVIAACILNTGMWLLLFVVRQKHTAGQFTTVNIS